MLISFRLSNSYRGLTPHNNHARAGRTQADAQVVMTELPLESIQQLGPRRFRFFRTVLAPSCRDSLDTLQQRSLELNQRLMALSDEYDVELVEQQRSWVGLDPIHIKLSQWGRVYYSLLSRWGKGLDAKDYDRLAPAPRLWIQLRTRTPYQRQLGWLLQQQSQPCWMAQNGSQFSLY